MALNKTRLASSSLKKHGAGFGNIPEFIEISTFDCGLAPFQLTSIESQFVVAVRVEADETFGLALAQVKLLIESNLLKITIRKNGEEAEFIERFRPSDLENLATERRRIREVKSAKVEVVLRVLNTIRTSEAQWAAFAQRPTHILIF